MEPRMSQLDEVARLVEAVSGLEQAIAGIAAILEGHGKMLARLVEAAEETPPDGRELNQLLRALIGRLDQQQAMLQRMEKGLETFSETFGKAAEQSGLR
jgi:hypothetical protein